MGCGLSVFPAEKFCVTMRMAFGWLSVAGLLISVMWPAVLPWFAWCANTVWPGFCASTLKAAFGGIGDWFSVRMIQAGPFRPTPTSFGLITCCGPKLDVTNSSAAPLLLTVGLVSTVTLLLMVLGSATWTYCGLLLAAAAVAVSAAAAPAVCWAICV